MDIGMGALITSLAMGALVFAAFLAWRPTDRTPRALRLGLLPTAFMATTGGGPVYRGLIGYHSTYGQSWDQWLAGAVILSIALAIPFIGFGFWRYKGQPQTPSNPTES